MVRTINALLPPLLKTECAITVPMDILISSLELMGGHSYSNCPSDIVPFAVSGLDVLEILQEHSASLPHYLFFMVSVFPFDTFYCILTLWTRSTKVLRGLKPRYSA